VHAVAAVCHADEIARLPEIDMPNDGKADADAAFPAAMNWQKRHQQSLVVIGSALVW
jgi:hypothetical protein